MNNFLSYKPENPRTVKTRKKDATASIDDAAILGVAHVLWEPDGITDNTFITGLQRKTTLDMGENNNCLTPSHPIGGYDRLRIIGNGTCDLAFGHEVKIELDDPDTTVAYLACYKPARDEISADVTNLVLYDMDMDMAGVTGSVGTTFAAYQPRPGQFLAVMKGGYETNSKLIISSAYTCTRYDSGTRIMNFAGVPVTVTIPATLPEGWHARFCQGDGNQITFAASGGNSILNYSSHTKTAGALAVADIDVYTNGSGGAVILSGNTGA